MTLNMEGPFHKVGFVWWCFLAAAVSEKVLPPENVHLSWSEAVYQQLTWTPPKHSMQNCTYLIKSKIAKDGHPRVYKRGASPWKQSRVLNGGYLNISIQTVCSHTFSEAVYAGLNDPGVPVYCATKSRTLTRCSWKPPDSAQLSFFYKLSIPDPDTDYFYELRECPRYNSINSIRTSCDLQLEDIDQEIEVLLNGTWRNRTIRNVHEQTTIYLNLPPLNWTVKESKDQFFISWSPPVFDRSWKYFIRYTACENKPVEKEIFDFTHKLDRVAGCSYDIAVRAKVDGGSGETEWTPDKHYGVATDTNPLLFAVILIPLVLVVLVVLTLHCCMKKKDTIFPKVPQPNPELFKDLINNNNKISVPNSYLPKAEEECEVTLVIDPFSPRL